LDKNGKTPLNVAQGIYPVQGNRIASPVAIANGEKVSVLKHLPADALVAGNVAKTGAPVAVSRTLPASTFTTRQGGVMRQSSIMYDPAEHRFVNSGQAVAATNNVTQPHSNVAKVNEATAGGGHANLPAARPAASFPTAAHNSVPAARPSMTPAPARVGGASSGGSSSGGGSGWGGGRGSGSSVSSPMPASSAGSSHPSSSGGGGRPH
jgi:hypothetical protein